MKKEIYLIRGSNDESYEKFSQRMLDLGKNAVANPKTSQVKVTHTLEKPPGLSIIPFSKKKIAAISITYQSDVDNLNLKTNDTMGVYDVDEAIPIGYEKTWDDGSQTPGICLLTIFKQRKDIPYEKFLDRWHNSHTPLSLKIHPLWNYNRNVARAKENTDSEDWDGIVEEQFRTKSELLNPIKFFGNPLIMPYRMWQVYSDTKSFLDYGTIETYFTSEYILKS